MTVQALVNARILGEQGFIDGHAVIVEGNRIKHVVAADDTRYAKIARHDLGGGLLLPGFVDSQVNGGDGVLFNDEPTVEAIAEIGNAHRKFGTTGFLPTLISDDLSVVSRGIAAVRSAIEAGVPGVLGIHIEGPFINTDRRGVHDPEKLRSLDSAAIELLTSLKNGKTLVTLAPEKTTPAMIAQLQRAGVIVSAGHTNATYQEIRAALKSGLKGFTHLFNAMSQLTGRAPGVVGAALEDIYSWCGIIVDGHHVDPAVLRIALRCKPMNRFMLVTDAMPSVGAASNSFVLQGRTISVEDGMLVDERGTLAGAHLDMASAVRNAISMLQLSTTDAVRMATRYPAEFLGLDADYGDIAPGRRANFVHADENLNVQTTWIDGVAS